MKYDVVIVGTGPAGGIVAYELSKRKLNVLVLEKGKLPRYKPCAGGLTMKAVNLLDFDISEVIEDRAYSVTSTLKYTNPFYKTVERPIVYSVMREKFDFLIIKKAIEEGAKVIDDQKVINVELQEESTVVHTERDSFQASIVIGADGVNSIVAKSLGLRKKRGVGFAIANEIYLNDERELRQHQGSVSLDYGRVPKGYAWIFPKKDHLSVGIFTTKAKLRNTKLYLDEYIQNKKISASICKKKQAALIPLGGIKECLHKGRALLVGDAAGLVDPFTGEGIYYAMKSAKLASEVVSDFLVKSQVDLSQYSALVNKQIVHDLKYARRFAFIFYNFPRICYKISTREDFSKYPIQLTVGETSYEELYRKLIRNIPKIAFFFR